MIREKCTQMNMIQTLLHFMRTKGISELHSDSQVVSLDIITFKIHPYLNDILK